MKTLIKKEYKNLLLIITLLFLIHLPLMTKNIISADILLNNYFYKGYSWEISLGRFGLYKIGILKSKEQAEINDIAKKNLDLLNKLSEV